MGIDDILKQAERDVQKPTAQRVRFAPTAGRIGTINGTASAVQPQATATPVAGSNNGKRKSGYARDLHPDLLDADEKAGLATPPASDTGAQEGRVPPALVKPKAHYEPVDYEEAMRRASQRRKGTMAPIAGGLSDPKVTSVAAMDQYADEGMEAHDRPDTVPGRTPVAEPVTRHTQERLVETNPDVLVPTVWVQPEPNPYSDFFKTRTRVSFVMPNGTYSVPAIAVRVEENGVIILLPCSDNDATFVPNAGSKFSIVSGSLRINCYFPGTVFTIQQLGVTVLTMLKDTAPDENR